MNLFARLMFVLLFIVARNGDPRAGDFCALYSYLVFISMHKAEEL